MWKLIPNWLQKKERKEHAKSVKKWRHDNNIKKSPLEMRNNRIYMRGYHQRPEVKERHKLYMREWRIKNEMLFL